MSEETWTRAVAVFRTKYPDITVSLFKLGVNCNAVLTVGVVHQDINLIKVYPRTKEATDIHIVWHIAKNPNIQYYVLSGDKGFEVLTYLDNNVIVLKPPKAEHPNLSEVERFDKLIDFLKLNGKADFCRAGGMLAPKKFGHNNVRHQLKGHGGFVIHNNCVRLKD